jgi:Cellulase (glycosyl hydrolase family 5)
MEQIGAITVSGGRLMRMGSMFLLRGPSILDGMISEVSPQMIRNAFIKRNFITLAVGADGNGYATAQPNSVIIPWVNAATALGFIVMLSDYVPREPPVRSGADLQASLNWYHSLALAFASNPNVCWTTENEVIDGGGDTSTMHLAIYNAIRTAGNNGLIFMEGNKGFTTAWMNPSVYAGMTGVGWNVHIYPWEFNTTSNNQTDYDNKVRNYVSTFQNFAKSRDGIMPVLMGEGGNSTGGSDVPPDDPIIYGKSAVVQSFINLTVTGTAIGDLCGYAAWLWNWFGQGGDSDTLVNADNVTLTDYGRRIANAP